MLIIFTQPSWAEDKTCTTSGCTYSVSLDRTGFYIAVVTLPSGQPEGVWSLLMNPGRKLPYYDGAFFAGGILKEHSQFGSWIGFSLAQGEQDSYFYLNKNLNLMLFQQEKNQHILCFFPHAY